MCDLEGATDLAEHFSCRSSGEPPDLRKALFGLADFMVEDPQQARALFVDAPLAGAPPATRIEAPRRLGGVLDAALRDEARRAPPSITGEFMVSAIDHLASRALLAGKPEEFRRRIPALVALVHSAYGLSDEAR